MNNWKCQTCGSTITEKDMQERIEDEDTELEDISEVILIDCSECEDEVATYKKTNITDSQESDNTTTRSKMLQAARS